MLVSLSEIVKAFAGKRILQGVSLQINNGEKIGIVGRNGCGKSTLLSIIYGDQEPDSGTIQRKNGLKIGRIEQEVSLDESQTVFNAARQANHEIVKIEKQLEALSSELKLNPSERKIAEYSALHERFENLGGFSINAKTESVLQGLGLGRQLWELPVNSLSGGQKNRLGLACLLLSSAELLLLDEPTNHLDSSAVEWLEDFLLEYNGSFILVSHDRYLLDRVVNRIIEIERGKARSFTGNYTEYLKASQELKELNEKAYHQQQEFIQRTEEFIRRNIAGQKTKQAKSRRKMLQKLELLEKQSDNQSFAFANKFKIQRSGDHVLTVKDLKIGYTDEKGDVIKCLAADINFNLMRGEFLGIVGENGCGKTTLLRTLAGKVRQLEGSFIWGTKTKPGYYSQTLEEFNNSQTVLEALREVKPEAENSELRDFLAGFLFFGEDVFKCVGELSGGEKGRLAISRLIFAGCNVLLLDEPTNHLDIVSREALEQALELYQGTVIAISHDRYFLDRLADKIALIKNGVFEEHLGGYSEVFEKLTTRQVEGDQIEKGKYNGTKQRDAEKIKNSAISKQKDPQNTALSKNRRMMLEKRLEEIIQEITENEQMQAELSSEISSPEIAVNRELFEAKMEKLKETEGKLDKLWTEWNEISVILENSSSY